MTRLIDFEYGITALLILKIIREQQDRPFLRIKDIIGAIQEITTDARRIDRRTVYKSLRLLKDLEFPIAEKRHGCERHIFYQEEFYERLQHDR